MKQPVGESCESNIDSVERVNTEAVRLVSDTRFYPAGMGRSASATTTIWPGFEQ